MRINLIVTKISLLKIALVAVLIVLFLYAGVQWYFSRSEIFSLHNITWTYPQPEFELQIKAVVRDIFWTEFLRLENILIKREHGQYQVSEAAVLDTVPDYYKYMWNANSHKSLPLSEYRPIRYVQPRDTEILLRAVAAPVEPTTAEQYPDGPTQVKVVYRFLGLRRTMSTTINLAHDVRQIAFEQLRDTEQEMVKDWRLGTVDETTYSKWSDEKVHKVTLPTKADAVFEHMAVYVSKFRSTRWKQEEPSANEFSHGLFVPGERTVRSGQQIFELNIHTDKLEYKTTEKIDLYATLKYVGNSKDIVIYSGTPYVVVYIDYGSGPSYGIGHILMNTVLNRGQVYRYEYPSHVGPSGPKQDLYLPPGEYTIGVLTHFKLTPYGENDYELPRKTQIIRVTE